MLPSGDHTPEGYALPVTGWKEWFKRLLRQLLYPPFNAIVSRQLAARYKQPDFEADLWLLGQRGNDYERHRRRINKLLPLQGRRVLVAGCGTGRDVASWAAMGPAEVIGVDWFEYGRAWDMWQTEFARASPSVRVSFEQGNLAHLSGIENASIDVVGSDAVFEHLQNLPAVLEEFRRVLRPGGLLYATFGPLWYGWGGDHVSGYDRVESGYNHLLLNPEDYREYLDDLGKYEHSEHDGRTWIEHDLFSRLAPREYLACLERAGFERLFVAAIIDPRGVRCLRAPRLGEQLRQRFDVLDLLVSGMTVIYRRPAPQNL